MSRWTTTYKPPGGVWEYGDGDVTDSREEAEEWVRDFREQSRDPNDQFYGYEWDIAPYTRNPSMTPNTMRYEKRYKIGDRGAVYEFNIKLSTKIRGVNVTDAELEDDANLAIEALEEDLRAVYPWIGRVYREGRSGGWLAVEDAKGDATEEELHAINDKVDEAVERFEDAIIESYGYESAKRLRRNASVDPKLRKRYDFFKEHQSMYVVGRAGLGALELARAERYADDCGWEAIWEEDAEEWDGEGEKPFELYTCVLRDENGVALASIGGVGFTGNTREDSTQRRVTEAELARQAMGEKGLKPNRRPSGRYVDELAEKSTARLRHMQSVVHQQLARAAQHRNTRAVEELQVREREIEAAIMRREFGHEPNGRAIPEARKFVTGTGTWWTFYKKGTIRGGDLEIHIHRVPSEQLARLDAQRLQREVGGFVGIFHNGVEVDSVGPERASWSAKAGRQTPNGRRTRWTDTMILESVRDHHGMTPEATERAHELEQEGLIDMRGTWRLTQKGEQYLRARRVRP